MKLSFDDFTSITFAESPKEMVEWAEGIIQQVTKVFGEQDDWANDLHLSHG